MAFFDSAGGGILGGVVGAISNIFTNAQQRKENERQRTFEHNEAILAHNRQMNATRELNEYNSPENQANLLKQAGFNPASLLGESGATVGRSTASAPSAQAHAPSVGGFRPILDPQMIVALSQAKLNDANAEKVKEDTKGSALQNAYQETFNQLYFTYEEELIKDGLSNSRSQRLLNQAETMLKGKQFKALQDELETMRPLQRANLIADTFASQYQGELSRIMGLKTEDERKIAWQDLALRTKIALSSITLSSALGKQAEANAYYLNTLGDAWNGGLTGSAGGVLYRGAQINNNQARLQYVQDKEIYKKTFSYSMDLLVKQIALQSGLTENQIRRYGFNADANWFDTTYGQFLWRIETDVEKAGKIFGSGGVPAMMPGKK